MHDAGLRRLVEELLGLGGGHRQRLVGDDVLALGDRGGVDGIVEVVGCGVVDDLYGRVVEQRFVAAVGFRHAEGIRLGLRRCVAAARDGHHVDKAQPPDCVYVMRADKTGPDNPHPDAFHQSYPPNAVIRTVIIYQGIMRFRRFKGFRGSRGSRLFSVEHGLLVRRSQLQALDLGDEDEPSVLVDVPGLRELALGGRELLLEDRLVPS